MSYWSLEWTVIPMEWNSHWNGVGWRTLRRGLETECMARLSHHDTDGVAAYVCTLCMGDVRLL